MTASERTSSILQIKYRCFLVFVLNKKVNVQVMKLYFLNDKSEELNVLLSTHVKHSR